MTQNAATEAAARYAGVAEKHRAKVLLEGGVWCLPDRIIGQQDIEDTALSHGCTRQQAVSILLEGEVA